jgi:hypothetical protein
MSEGPTPSDTAGGSALADARHGVVGPVHNPGRGDEALGVGSPGVALQHRRPGLWKLVTEVVFISLGVFLALLADQWREDRQMRALAASSLRGFRSEIVANREKVVAVKDYHVALLGSLRTYLAADDDARPKVGVTIRGIQPVFFDQTAWDLAMGTQSLAHLDQGVASSLSRIYGLQRTYHEQTRGIMQAVYLRPLDENYSGLASYYGDVVLWEPALIRMYDEVLPRIDRALGQ